MKKTVLIFAITFILIFAACEPPGPESGKVTINITGITDGESFDGGPQIFHNTAVCFIYFTDGNANALFPSEVILIDSETFTFTSPTIEGGSNVSAYISIAEDDSLTAESYDVITSVADEKCEFTMDGNRTINLDFSDTEFYLWP